MKKIISIVSFAMAAYVSAFAAAPLTEKKGDGLYGITAGKVSMVIDAGKGAKVLSFKYENKEVISQLQRFNAFGSTFWTSPQTEWNWPPVAEYDRNPYEVEMSDDSIVMTGQISDRFKYSIRKVFKAVPEKNSVVVSYSIVNHSLETRKVAPWEITRVPGDGLIFFECASKDIWPAGIMDFKDKKGCAWYTFDENKENRKINADGKGWLAYANGELLLVKHFPDIKAGEEAPKEAEIQVYVNQGKTFIELESQGAYTTIAPGESLTYTVEWYLLPYQSDGKPSSKLVKTVKNTIK